MTLNLTKDVNPQTPPSAPPGLSQIEVKNRFKVLDENESKAQKNEDMKEMQKDYANEFPKAPMGNYSKRGQRFEKFPKAAKTLNLFEKQAQAQVHQSKGEQQQVKELLVASSEDGWTYVKGVVDSGAVESVSHPSMCPQHPTQSSPASRAGEGYTSASGDFLPCLGEKILPVMTLDGRYAKVKYQQADVSRALNSVSEICDGGGEEGQLVLFSKHGGVVLNLETWQRTSFEREGGIYTMGMWVQPPEQGAAASVFARPGQ